MYHSFSPFAAIQPYSHLKPAPMAFSHETPFMVHPHVVAPPHGMPYGPPPSTQLPALPTYPQYSAPSYSLGFHRGYPGNLAAKSVFPPTTTPPSSNEASPCMSQAGFRGHPIPTPPPEKTVVSGSKDNYRNFGLQNYAVASRPVLAPYNCNVQRAQSSRKRARELDENYIEGLMISKRRHYEHKETAEEIQARTGSIRPQGRPHSRKCVVRFCLFPNIISMFTSLDNFRSARLSSQLKDPLHRPRSVTSYEASFNDNGVWEESDGSSPGDVREAIQRLLGVEDFHFVKVVRTSAQDKDGIRLARLETVECPKVCSTEFLKKQIIFPRYKAHMRVYVVPVGKPAVLYTDVRMKISDEAKDAESNTNRDVFTFFQNSLQINGANFVAPSSGPLYPLRKEQNLSYPEVFPVGEAPASEQTTLPKNERAITRGFSVSSLLS